MYCFKAKDADTLDHQVKLMKQYASELKYSMDSIEIQIFKTSIGILFRVLEAGYGLRNILWENKDQFPTCDYDDRSDIPEEDEGNAKIAEELDQLILNKDYVVSTICERSPD